MWSNENAVIMKNCKDSRKLLHRIYGYATIVNAINI